ncbi:MAG: type I-A CRISPR-associated protein Cas5 [Bacilli bacterium]
MSWLVASYQFTSPFSLKSSLSTSSGGKTHLIPTMYAIKMALIDASFRCGLDGEKEFEWIKTLDIRMKPPKKANVQNSFVKIQKEARSEVRKEKPDQYFSSTVTLREYVIFEGNLSIAFKVNSINRQQQEKLETLLTHLNQLGKRGCFIQLQHFSYEEALQGAYTFLLQDTEIHMSLALTVHYLDDMGEGAKFSSINSYDETSAKLGKDRILIPVGVPYQLSKSSRAFTYYERMDD